MTRIIFDVRAASGELPETTPVEGAQIDFAPHQARRVEYEGGAYWLTQTIAPVVLPTGAGESDFLPTPVGGAYEVQERVGPGSRSGFVQVPDQDSIRYEDLVWVDGDTLDPIVEPEAAWWATAGQAITDAAEAKADAVTALGAAEQANETASNAETAAAGAVAESADARVAAEEALAGLDTKADLVAGKVPTAQIPSISLVEPHAVANRTAMLALTGVQQGDVATITGGADKGTYMLDATGDPTVFGHWVRLNTPDDSVSTVNGQQGTVVLGKGDVGLPNADNTSDANKPVSGPQLTELNKKVNGADLPTLSRAARNPDLLIVGAITRDSNGAATAAPVVWPDGTPGNYGADSVSAAFPGAVDGYHITYGSPVTKTFTQPAVTRDSSGAVTNLPALVVT